MLLLNLHMHYIGYGAVGGIVEFMPDPFLKTYLPFFVGHQDGSSTAAWEGREENLDWGAVDFRRH